MSKIAHKGFSKVPIVSDDIVKGTFYKYIGFLKIKSILSYQG